MICPKCKVELSENSKFCSACGSKVESGKTCPNLKCGRTGLPQDAQFCPDCGSKIEICNEKQSINPENDNTKSKVKNADFFFGLITMILVIAGIVVAISISESHSTTENDSYEPFEETVAVEEPAADSAACEPAAEEALVACDTLSF